MGIAGFKPEYIVDGDMSDDIEGAWMDIFGQTIVDFQAVWEAAAARSIVHNAADKVVVATKTWDFINGGFSAADVGGTFTVSGTASSGANDGTYTIASVTDADTIVSVEAPGGSNETFGSGVTVSLQQADPVGAFEIDATLDGTDLQYGYTPNGRLGPSNLTLPSSWTASFPGESGDVGEFLMELSKMGARAVRLRYVWESGGGVLQAGFSAKREG